MSADLRESLCGALRGRVVVLGVGNPLLGDDAIGCRIAQDLAALDGLRHDVTIIDAEEIPESYVGPVVAARPEVVLMVDAADLGAEPGAVALVSSASLDDRAVVTHRTPLGPVAKYLAAETGARILLLGVQPGARSWGAALSEPVDATARELVSLLFDALTADERCRHVAETAVTA